MHRSGLLYYFLLASGLTEIQKDKNSSIMTYAYYHYTVPSNIKRDKELPIFVQLNRPPYYFSKAVVTIMNVYGQDTRTT